MVVCLYGGTISLYSFCPREKQGSNFYIKKYFFNELGCIVLGRISQLQKAAGIKGLFALL